MHNLNVLAVDDEPGMRSGMERILSSYKMKLADIDEEICFTVDLAESGEQAIEKIIAQRPDILLLDYKMPGMTGLELLEQINTGDDKLLTIMITAYASLETAVSAIKSGAFDFLAKPFTPDELKVKISKAAQSVILARQVRKLNEEKKQVRFQFISVLGHELKSPLSAIVGYLNMFHSRTVGNDIGAYDQMIERCLVRTDQMSKLIVDILEMTKIESGQRPRDLQDTNLYDCAKMSIESVIPDANAKNINVNLNADPSLKMICDREEIDMVLNNLITNAVKYNRKNGQVDISLSKSEDRVTICVKDTGIGMTDVEIAKLFGEFVRIKNSKTKDILGSGLGLSTVKKIAALYGGDATVESTPDVGSTFTVVLNDNLLVKN